MRNNKILSFSISESVQTPMFINSLVQFNTQYQKFRYNQINVLDFTLLTSSQNCNTRRSRCPYNKVNSSELTLGIFDSQKMNRITR